MNLANTEICITGGNNGLGLVLVRLLAEVCKKVIVLDTTPERDVIKKLKNVTYSQVDCTGTKLEFKVHDVDILIIDAGLINSGKKSILNLKFSEIEEMINVNLKLNLFVMNSLKPRKVVIIGAESSNLGDKFDPVFCACMEFYKIFNEGLQREGVNSMIVYPERSIDQCQDDSDLLYKNYFLMARRIKEGIEDDSKEVSDSIVSQVFKSALEIPDKLLNLFNTTVNTVNTSTRIISKEKPKVPPKPGLKQVSKVIKRANEKTPILNKDIKYPSDTEAAPSTSQASSEPNPSNVAN